ncbi:MAG: thermostable hemolysin [Woeseiaceae bacterium]
MTSFDANNTTSVLPALAAPGTYAAHEPGLPALELLGPDADASIRGDIENRIAATFANRYGAKIDHFLPYLLRLSASEQYLDVPIEQAVSREFRTPVDRAQIVEIGNLASLVQGSATLLFALLPAILRAAGMRWVVCTATPQVLAMLGKLQFPVRTICTADPDLLGDDKDNWGSYYSNRPRVIVGDVQTAVRQASKSRATFALRQALGAPIHQIAATLRSAG